MNNCPKCGFILSPGETACSNCGEPIQNENSIGMNTGGTVDPTMPAMPEIPIIRITPEDLNDTPIESSVPVAQEPTVPAMDSNIPTMPESSTPIVDSGMPIVPEPTAPVMDSNIPAMPEFPTPIVDPGMPIVPEPTAPVMDSNIPTMPESPTPIVDPGMSIVLESTVPIMDTGMPSMLDSSVPPLSEESKEVTPFSEKFNRITFIAVLVISFIAIAILSFFIIKMFSQEEKVPVKNTLEQAKEYHYEGFDFYIPDDIYVEIYNGEFYVGSREAKWSAVMTLQTGNYNTLVSNKSQLLDHFKKVGYEAKEPEEKEISGTAFVVTEVMMGTKNVLVAYTKANGTKVFGIVLENESGEYSDEDLKPIGTILAATKYMGPTYELPEGFQIELFKESFTVAQ